MKIKTFHIRLTKEHLYPDETQINIFFEEIQVIKTEAVLVQAQTIFWSIVIFYQEKAVRKLTNNSKLAALDYGDLSEADKQLYEVLRIWRQDRADKLKVPNFLVCHTAELFSIAKYRPQSLDELAKIKGFGSHKIAKIGDDILALLNSV